LLAAGDQLWIDRFMAQHAAIVYYIILVALFVASPKLAYNFSELIEAHAVDTYGEFADANEELLKTLPPPFVAVQYYLSGGIRRFACSGGLACSAEDGGMSKAGAVAKQWLSCALTRLCLRAEIAMNSVMSAVSVLLQLFVAAQYHLSGGVR
jgi:hypothetical protein